MREKVSRNIWLIQKLISINRAIFRFFRKIGLVLFDGAPLIRYSSAVPSRSVKNVFSVGHIAPAVAFRSAAPRSGALSAEMVTFLWREKSPAGGKTPFEILSGTGKKKTCPRQRAGL